MLLFEGAFVRLTPLSPGSAMSEAVPKKKLLFLCQTLPFPPDGGVNIRSYHLLRLLAQEYEVTALCFYRRAARPTPADVTASLEGLRKLADVEAYPIPQEHNRARWLWDHVRSVMTGRPYTVFTYASSDVERRLDDLLANRQFDLVHIDSLDLAHYVPMVDDLPIVCDHHNVESSLLERRAAVQTSRVKRWYMGLQAELTRKEEHRSIGKFALNITCSELDAESLRGMVPSARVETIPNGVDTHTFGPSSGELERDIVFVGGYTWFPNRDGMEWFADAILPHIRERLPAVSTTWVGRMPPDVGDRFAAQGVEVTGYVDDIRPYVTGAACFIVPLRVGGGTRLKVVDAWAMGKAVVSTTVGAEGLEAVDGDNVLLRDEPQAFADAVVEVLEDRELRTRMERAARSTAERVYDWELIGRKLLSEYGEVSNDASTVAGPG